MNDSHLMTYTNPIEVTIQKKTPMEVDNNNNNNNNRPLFIWGNYSFNP